MRSPLQRRKFMLLCFPVPPFKRQAAGPLTENLPNVGVCGPDKIGCQLSSPAVTAKQANDLPYETQRKKINLRPAHVVGFDVHVRHAAARRGTIRPLQTSGACASEGSNQRLVAGSTRWNFSVHSQKWLCHSGEYAAGTGSLLGGRHNGFAVAPRDQRGDLA